ncbi:tetratricopeptide repeat protein [Chryseobacterium formosus]|uniref:Tetratricopeptide repeat protein n=1 Tax=Chryseobacterium formosus TaxID=1537363 RepID=A0ABT3XU34_9FLAO|nr:tetratricopeptide repeat protein [Chryseobacterium formosus]MCX8524664.1 tetratricopeptide repeat protein [Chryseobacterium formosus]
MLSATLLQQSGEVKKSIEYALKAEDIVVTSEEHLWQAKVYGFLSSQYRNLGLFDQSKKYVEKAEKAIGKLDNQQVINNMKGLLMQEKAYHEIEFKKYSKAIDLIKKSQNYFDLANNKEFFLTATNLQLEGQCYFKLGNYEKATVLYDKAKVILDPMPDNFLKGLVYNGIAQVYIATQNFEKAKQYLKTAEEISEKSNYLHLKKEIYTTSQQYYLETKNIKKFEEVTHKKDSTLEKIDRKTTSFINKEFSELEKKNRASEKNAVKKNYYLVGIAALFGIVLIFLALRRKRQHVKLKLANEQLVEMQRRHSELEIQNQKPKESDHPEPTKTISVDSEQPPMMTAATEQKLLAKLEKFEKTTLYTRNSISLPFLASYCETNTKYLSYVINHFKRKDFNNYINELRINFILEKLQTEPKYQKYKIASLAEEAGFSSQSKFAGAFKKVTHISPSQYLHNLRESQL